MRAALVLAALAACKGHAKPPPASVDASTVTVTASFTPIDAGPPPHVVWLLDTFEREPDAKVRDGLALEIGREDAVGAGVDARVIALVRAYELMPNGDSIASSLMMSLIHHEPPQKPVADLALETARSGGSQTRFVAFYLLPKLIDRLPDVCALMAELAPLPDAVDTVALLHDACIPHLDPVIDALVRVAEADRFEVEHMMAARVLAQNTRLTPAQRNRLTHAAKLARKHADHHEADFADALLRQLAKLR